MDEELAEKRSKKIDEKQIEKVIEKNSPKRGVKWKLKVAEKAAAIWPKNRSKIGKRNGSKIG